MSQWLLELRRPLLLAVNYPTSDEFLQEIEGEIPEHMQQQESEDVRTAVSLCRPVPGLPRLSAHPPVCAHPSCELTPDAGMLVCCVLRTLALLGRTR